MVLSGLGQKLARIGRDTKHGVQKMSDSVSIRGRISSEKRSLERLFAVIGESVYKENPDKPKEGLEDEYAAVKVAYANLDKYSRQLDQVNGIIYCPSCGKPADPGDKFCAKCGTRLTGEEGTGARLAQDFKEVGQEMGKIAVGVADKTGEFFGSAAAKTKNGLTSLRDRGTKLMKDAALKRGREEEQEEQTVPEEMETGDQMTGNTDPAPSLDEETAAALSLDEEAAAALSLDEEAAAALSLDEETAAAPEQAAQASGQKEE